MYRDGYFVREFFSLAIRKNINYNSKNEQLLLRGIKYFKRMEEKMS